MTPPHGVRAVARAAAFAMLAAGVQSRAQEDLELSDQGLGISLWDESFSVRTGAGYQDNVLLAPTDKKASGFLDTGLDAMVYRLPVGVWQYYFIASGDDDRFWRNVGVGSEDTWLGAAKIQRDFGDAWQGGLALSYSYEAQVLDLLTSANLAQEKPTKVIGNTVAARPFVRRSLGTNYVLELQVEATRQWYGAPAFSYWRFGPKLTLTRSYGDHSELSLDYGFFDQPFDNEPRAGADGANLPGEPLSYLSHKVDLLWRHHWDSHGAWTTASRVDFTATLDNGAGYYSYYRYGFSEQVNYEAHGWKIAATASLEHYDYPVQTADDPQLDKLYANGFTVSLHVDRALTKWLKVFADYEYDRMVSNDLVNEYAGNTFKGGLQWEF